MKSVDSLSWDLVFWFSLVALALPWVPTARADSPLTSIDLAAAYSDLEVVALASQSQRVAGEVLGFLLSDAPCDHKAAVVCALGWKFEGQRNAARFPPGRRNLRPAAVAAAEDYLSGYEKECPGTPAAKAVQLAGLNQVYSLGMLGGQLAAGTQAGVVIWGGAAWLGCDREVVRWDGKSFRKYLPMKSQDSVYHQPMLGPGGALWTRDGKLWWIDFLDAIETSDRRYALKSEDYPGRDPRRLREDSLGHLWVEDFESGLFRLDPASGRFEPQPGLPRQATGVAFDLSREWIWMLEYRRGLTAVSNGRVMQTIDLSDLDCMRDLLVTDSGEVWVAGWNQIVRLTPKGDSFERTSYVVR